MNQDLVDKTCFQGLLSWRSAAELNMLIRCGSLCQLYGLLNSFCYKGNIGRSPRHAIGRWGDMCQNKDRHSIHRMTTTPTLRDLIRFPAKDKSARFREHLFHFIEI